jgi:hypothetical protein
VYGEIYNSPSGKARANVFYAEETWLDVGKPTISAKQFAQYLKFKNL